MTGPADIKAIVFDFGQVVGFFDHRVTTSRLVSYASLSTDELHGRLFGTALEDDYESGRLTTEQFLREVREACRLNCSEAFLATAWADIFLPNPDVCALIPRLKPNYRLLLASNTNELHSQQFTRQFAQVLAHFDAIVLSYRIGVRKPRPGFFEHCQRLAQCTPGECLFIDDLSANVAGAVACGWHGVVYKGFEDLLGQLAALGIRGLGNQAPLAKKRE
jgi:HAD superfamily hydrolase (TIGR01509 family)